MDLPADLAALLPEAPGPCPAQVVRQRPGNEEWGVRTLVPRDLAAQPRPCSGEKVCPWRRDAPLGQFPPEVYVHSAPGNRLTGPPGLLGCHSSTAARPLLCAGWLVASADGNAEVLAMMDAGALPRPELPAGIELYDSYAEMAAANGVDPDLPALHARPVPDQDLADFVPLQHVLDDHYAGEGAPAVGWTGALTAELKRSMPPGALLGLVLAADEKVLELQLLRVSIGHRGQGHATRVLGRLCEEADARRVTVVCTPTDEFGADLVQLERFYRRFGFNPVAPEHRLTKHSWQRPPTLPGLPEGVDVDMVQQLRAGLDFYRPLVPDSYRGWRYPTFADLVLAHGRLYAPAPWPGGPQRPGQCFAAAHALADREGWTYCEGFALLPSSAGPVPYGAVEHAWCLTDEGRVADPALPDGYAALYWGLPLAEAFRAEHRRARGDNAVLTYGTDPFRTQLNEVLRTELPATALVPLHPAAPPIR
ncbi:DUF6283 family protein [Streptomyces mobaraensis]|uniref:DUF6283 family protein n=1 Tax=Streptomyces mobaraensis TaxID=35621 RepID=UPI001F03504D|nr:DUF6283 family protein [Streptomyces mobaraensis]